MTRIYGQTLEIICDSLSDEWREHYRSAIVKVIQDMTRVKGPKICGVDGKNFRADTLARNIPDEAQGFRQDYSPEAYFSAAQEIGMDCSSFCLFHMSNINVESMPQNGKIGIVNWKLLDLFLKDGF